MSSAFVSSIDLDKLRGKVKTKPLSLEQLAKMFSKSTETVKRALAQIKGLKISHAKTGKRGRPANLYAV
jgi:transposase